MKIKLFIKSILPKHHDNRYSRRVHPHGELALVSYQDNIGALSVRAFFVRNISMLSHLYGEAGEGHFRVCWFPMSPVDQPFSALPPSFGHEWQGFYQEHRSALIMPNKNIHHITRNLIQSTDFAHKPSLTKRISSMLKKVWGV